jgi:outer membrane protein OmpA-like peptidoglycan-associated protein
MVKIKKFGLTFILMFFLLLSNSILNNDELLGRENLSSVDTSITYIRNPWTAGLFAGISFNNHFVDFHKLPGIPNCCPHFSTGFGIGPAFGGLFDYMLYEQYKLSLETRASYTNLCANLSAEEKVLMFQDPVTSVEGLIEHNIETSIHSISIQPIFKVNLYENLNFHLGLSFSWFASDYFEQEEVLKEPKNLVFVENDKRTRNFQSGSLPGATDFYSSLISGINYDIHFNKKNDWFLSPELFLEYGLNDIISSSDWEGEYWNVLSVRLALAVNYNGARKEIEKLEHYEQIDTIKIELPHIAEMKAVKGYPRISFDTLTVDNITTITENYYRTDTLFTPPEYVLTAKVFPVPLEADNNLAESATIKVEEFLATNMKPLLNYVFFDSNSYQIPKRYKLLDANETKDFDILESFTDRELGFYHNILNIIGKKMQMHPASQITLTGCNSNNGAERNNITLSKNRAQTVKDYLTNVWKIDPDRVDVKTRNLPSLPSNPSTEDGVQENRRVEIFSEEFKITSSLIDKDTVLELTFLVSKVDTIKKANFGGFRLFTSVNPDVELDNWKLSIVSNNDTLKTFSGSGTIPISRDWKIDSADAPEILAKPLKIVLEATDIDGNKAIDSNVPDVELQTLAMKRQDRVTDLKYDSFSMMLFEFGSHSLNDENREFPKIIRNLLTENAQVSIIGYSDRVGNDDYNLRLSERRAKTVADAIGHPNTTYLGVGEQILLYNNTLPEGRFYCRTVDILVETPIHW